ncbi:MAG TPA: hypothetical protein VN894_08235 [Polyangiaceae bacterium]|nr:hypothetical protein [Polyangiaceae bacterium]
MKRYIALFAIALAACTNGQGEVDVTSTNSATFPGVPLSAGEGQLRAESVTTEAPLALDVQSDLASLSNLGALTGVISKNSISGADLSVVRHIRATIETADGKMPAQLASDVDVPADSTEVELALSMSDAQVLDYLTEGKVVIHFYVTGTIPDRPITLTHTLVAHMGIAVKGSVWNL